jgi:hypothetical protein
MVFLGGTLGSAGEVPRSKRGMIDFAGAPEVE